MSGGRGGSFFGVPGGAGGTVDPLTGAPGAGESAPSPGTGGGGGSAGGGAGGAGTTIIDPGTGQSTSSGAGGAGGLNGIGPVAIASSINNALGSGGSGANGDAASGSAPFAQDNAAGGGGGEGGYGLIVTGNGDGVTTFTNTAALSGGEGGKGGFGLRGGNGGYGGIALALLGSDAVLVNLGTLNGGAGGSGGGSNYSNSVGDDGEGGAGVVGAANLSVVNVGSITGGLSADGISRADAITFTSGENTLTLGAAVDGTPYQQGVLLGDIGIAGTLSLKSGSGSNTPTTLSNNIHGSGSLKISDANSIRLTGVSTYFGDTEVDAGGLVLDGSIVSNTSVSGGGYLAGSGRILGNVEIISGDLSAAASTASNPINDVSAGTLTIQGNLTLSANARVFEDILGPNSFDELDVSGAVDLGGASLEFYPQITAASVPGDTITIIKNDGIDSIVGVFAGAPEGQTMQLDGHTFRISYVGNSDSGPIGNDVTLTDITAGGTGGDGGGGGGGGGGGSGGSPPALATPTEGDDNLAGTPDNDTVSLLAGDDRYDGGLGSDLIYGNQGNDTIPGSAGQDTVYGGQNNDTVGYASSGDPALIYGNLGDDSLSGGSAGDTLFGGQGRDTVAGGSGNDVVYGNIGNDLIYGNQGQDTLYGGQGVDTTFGGQGNDVVYGNLGDDIVYGNTGNDLLFGGQANDVLYGGMGDDTLIGGLGNDTLAGGKGTNTYWFSASLNTGTDVISGFNQAQGDKLDFGGQAFTSVDDNNGGTLITLANGGTVDLSGVANGSLTAAAFA